MKMDNFKIFEDGSVEVISSKNISRIKIPKEDFELLYQERQSRLKENRDLSCNHEWRVNPYAFEEGCIGAICIKCGERGCGCDVRRDNNDEIPEDFWNNEGREYIDNENGGK